MQNAAKDNPEFESIAARCLAGERLGEEEGLALFRGPVAAVAELAEAVTLRRRGRDVLYRRNRHIHAGNVCEMGCEFCHFHRQSGDPEGYVRGAEEIAETAAEAAAAGASEVHVVGGIWPGLTLEYGEGVVGAIRRLCPRLKIRAWTATEIAVMAERAGVGVKAVLGRLVEAGLGSLPGGGAEILDEGYFGRHCPRKPGPERWVEVHRTAHRLGLNSGATMLFGHDEGLEQRINHLLRLRELQDEAVEAGRGRFSGFVPLPYIDAGGRGPDAAEVIRTVAAARLMLDNFEHVKAFWPMLGVELAQVALGAGADDFEGTVDDYRIVGGRRRGLAVERMEALIREAQRRPVLIE